MILKCYLSLVSTHDAGLLLPIGILLISSARIEFAAPKDFISLKPKPENWQKKDPAKSRVKNRD
ncbi:hypothetical protein [Pseudomonas fluorescens]|uniref:hypothetical protein n=1 Tax=Pseudomonas fluorescens TaxID=294 RepID=UPI001240CD2A|nr:hypothetical protein [Pseudomonas fluorescens]